MLITSNIEKILLLECKLIETDNIIKVHKSPFKIAQILLGTDKPNNAVNTRKYEYYPYINNNPFDILPSLPLYFKIIIDERSNTGQIKLSNRLFKILCKDDEIKSMFEGIKSNET